MARGHSTPETAIDRGPVAMASTSLGTLYLCELEPRHLEQYDLATTGTAAQRVRSLLPRIASRAGATSSGPTLTPADVAALRDDEVEQLVEAYLSSPGNLRRDREVGRAPGESAVGYFDRLVQWEMATRTVGLADEVGSRPVEAREPAAERGRDAGLLRPGAIAIAWALLATSTLLSFAAAWYARESYERAEAARAANEQWQAEMKAIAERNASSFEKGRRALAQENAVLRARMETLEARSAAARQATTRTASTSAAAPKAPSRRDAPSSRARTQAARK